MSEIAFVSPPELSLGAVQSGLRACPVAGADQLEEKLVDLAREGASVVVVTEDLVKGRIGELAATVRSVNPATALLVVPRHGRAAREHLEHLRRRFAAALGVDVWDTAAKRSGVDF